MSYTEATDSNVDDARAQPECPVKECNLYVDLVLESSDGIRCGAHKTNLEQYSAGFPIAEATISDHEVVTLSEKASVLHLLLQFMHNTRQPELRKLSFPTLALLAEAVEKYMVFPGMQVCKLQMGIALKDHPLEVFLYAIKHDYGDLADEVAPSLIHVPFETFMDQATSAGLSANAVIRFIRYREHWSSLLNILYGPLPVFKHSGGIDTCENWAEFYTAILLDVKLDAGSLSRFSVIVGGYREILDDCTHCWKRAGWLKRKIGDGINTIPRFSSI